MSSNNNPFKDKAGLYWRWPRIFLTIKPLEERHFVTLAIILMIAGMLVMARENPELWKVELFKTLLTAVVMTGFLNMVVAYHFAANKGDEKKVENTSAAFRAIEATAVAGGNTDSKKAATAAAEEVADAAVEAADVISNAPGQTEMDYERNR